MANKLTWEFDLEDPNGKQEFEMCWKAHSYYAMLVTIADEFRNKQKYGDDSAKWKEPYAFLWEIFNDHKFNPWEEIQ